MSRTSHLIAKWRTGLFACLASGALLAGCSTGQNFSGDALARLQPGTTTMNDAVGILQAMPQQVMPQSDGSTLALWAYKISLVTDAVYYRREAVLQFSADGRLARVLDTTNVPLSDATRQKLLGVASIPQVNPAQQNPAQQNPAAGGAAQTSPPATVTEAPPSGVTAIPVPTQ